MPASGSGTKGPLHADRPGRPRERGHAQAHRPGYGTATFAVQLFLPAGREPPYGVVFYMPHSGEFFAPVTTDGFDPASGGIRFDFLLESGWALAVVALDGAFERRWTAERRQSMTRDERVRTRLRHWRQELGRTIDGPFRSHG